jgi:hypothetical protein
MGWERWVARGEKKKERWVARGEKKKERWQIQIGRSNWVISF